MSSISPRMPYKENVLLDIGDEGNCKKKTRIRLVKYFTCPETNEVRGRVYFRGQGIPLL
jgi:hypothetical protein